MGLREEIQEYREPGPFFVTGLRKNPGPRSTDNCILFTFENLLAMPWTEAEASDFEQFILACEISPGLLARYPGLDNATSHDDITAALCFSRLSGRSTIAKRIYNYGVKNAWTFQGNWLGRIIDLPGIAQICADAGDLTFRQQCLAALPFLANLFEAKEQTSGKRLLWIKSVVYNHELPRYPLLALAITLWKFRMMVLYKNPRGMDAIYFGADYPLTKWDSESFWESTL